MLPSMLTIGRFADATGLTVKALRHYDEIGLLVPAHVNPQNGYRHYAEEQIVDAVTIRRLRALELPLDEIAGLLTADAAGFRAGLAAHGYRVAGESSDKLMLRIELSALLEGGGSPVEIEFCDEPELRLAAVIRRSRRRTWERRASFRFAPCTNGSSRAARGLSGRLHRSSARVTEPDGTCWRRAGRSPRTSRATGRSRSMTTTPGWRRRTSIAVRSRRCTRWRSASSRRCSAAG
jgi:DNA-binding transcriptional MerR regulator